MLDQDALIPSILEPDELSKESRRNWARLIQKIYEVDPLTCPIPATRLKAGLNKLGEHKVVWRLNP
jgi:hypothetical protein